MLATDPLSLVFLFCFLFGLLFLLAVAFLGHFGHGHAAVGHDAGVGHGIGHGLVHGFQTHVSDPFHAAHAPASHSHGGTHAANGQHTGTQSNDAGHHFSLLSLFNPTAIVLFLLWFGFFGYMFHNAANLALPFTIIGAVVGGFIVAALIISLLDRLIGQSEASTVQDLSERTGLVGKVNRTIPSNNLGEIIYVSPGGHRKSIPARALDGSRLERGQEIVVLNYQGGVAEVDTWEHFIEQEGDKLNAGEVDELQALLNDLEAQDTYVMRQNMQKE